MRGGSSESFRGVEEYWRGRVDAVEETGRGPGNGRIGVTGFEASHSYSEHRERRGKAHLAVLRLRAQSAS